MPLSTAAYCQILVAPAKLFDNTQCPACGNKKCGLCSTIMTHYVKRSYKRALLVIGDIPWQNEERRYYIRHDATDGFTVMHMNSKGQVFALCHGYYWSWQKMVNFWVEEKSKFATKIEMPERGCIYNLSPMALFPYELCTVLKVHVVNVHFLVCLFNGLKFCS